MRHTLQLKTLAALTLAAALAACGGGGGDDGGGGGGGGTITAPTATACCTQTVQIGETVSLQGSGQAANGGALSYLWTVVSKPADSQIQINGPSSQSPSFTPDVYGEYVIDLKVSEASGGESHERVTITVANPEPTAALTSASAQQSVLLGDLVKIDGSASLPPTGGDASALEYEWVLAAKPDGSAATLADATGAQASFTADVVGVYEVELSVKYGNKRHGPVKATVTAGLTNRAPVADAGQAQTAERGATVKLDASGSADPDGDALMYRWATLITPRGSKAVLDDWKSATPSFVPDVAGDYTAYLDVYDAKGMKSGTQSSVKITVAKPANAANTPPVANIRHAMAGETELGTVVSARHRRLFGDNSYDVDGDPLTYKWKLVSAPAGSSETWYLNEYFSYFIEILPDVAGTFEFELIVNDGQADSAPVRGTIVSKRGANLNNGSTNIAPVAQTILMGSEGCFTANTVQDGDGDRIVFSDWKLMDRPENSAATLTVGGEFGERACFTSDRPGPYQASVTMTDDRGSPPVTATSSLHAKAGNVAPVINTFGLGWNTASFNEELGRIEVNRTYVQHQPALLLPGMRVLIGGNATDADGDRMYTLWQPVEKPAGSTVDAVAPNPTTNISALHFTPDVPGRYTWEMVVSDGMALAGEPRRMSFDVQSPDAYTGLRIVSAWDKPDGGPPGSVSDMNFSDGNTYAHQSQPGAPVSRAQLADSSILHFYTATAGGRAHTITDLKVESSDPAYPGFFDGLTNNQVIPAGSSVEFRIMFPDLPANTTTEDIARHWLYSFTVKETGETFRLAQWVTSRRPAN